MKTKQRIHEGTAHVCAHRVSYFYRLPKFKRVTPVLKERMDQEAEERAKSQIIEGYVQGELNYETENFQAQGWWSLT